MRLITQRLSSPCDSRRKTFWISRKGSKTLPIFQQFCSPKPFNFLDLKAGHPPWSIPSISIFLFFPASEPVLAACGSARRIWGLSLSFCHPMWLQHFSSLMFHDVMELPNDPTTGRLPKRKIQHLGWSLLLANVILVVACFNHHVLRII